jgi:uncharacterized protein YecE (DUF72 family)
MPISIGCGSWADAAYTGVLYPRGLPAGERLSVYANHFQHVEVNSSYYRTPARALVAGWVRQTPPGFIFDLKLHRAFSQNPGRLAPLPAPVDSVSSRKKGKIDPAQKRDLAAYTLEQLQPLLAAGRLGTFLLTLSPRFTPEGHRLDELDGLVTALQPHRLAVELRHRDWVTGRARAGTLAYFRERGLTWVAVDMPLIDQPGVMPPIDEVTQPALAYLRLHGRNATGYATGKSAAERHTYAYTAADLKEIVARIRRLAKKAALVHVVANNHARDFAPRTALELRRLLGQTGVETPSA